MGEGLREASWALTQVVDPTACRAEARGVRWGRLRNGSAGRGSETGNRGPRAESKGNAAGSCRQAQEAREQRYRRGQTGEFLGETGPLPSPHPHGWGGPRAAYPADHKEVGHQGWRQTLRPREAGVYLRHRAKAETWALNLVGPRGVG